MNLTNYLIKHKQSQAEFAKRIGVTTPELNRWIKGHRRIPERVCIAIEDVTKGCVKCEELRPDVRWKVLRSA